MDSVTKSPVLEYKLCVKEGLPDFEGEKFRIFKATDDKEAILFSQSILSINQALTPQNFLKAGGVALFRGDIKIYPPENKTTEKKVGGLPLRPPTH
ncbi:MAG: hypothetical protein A3A96_00350 [Candidatus Zambryskibacteria bacterium RIFCSPLOWO2_01_FULL_39_39]|uniref:Uncharacterized protein n=1 Tax=Candidatus Zambryskibacteria bacterium RIFCSPLOWO2_01_FULL_39_39 TaxID=1802758 RepID=A0A1G2TX50_9BACT|nr:MAG: hypothetical protein UT00_C0001G0032 [Parcubacteria group bacterium GW2011_GWA1_38_7]OHA87842.1 MAG: hypothetical protein A2644_01545 [Candidatus Zambryskibacteria bacterium RIFCSPHIGHO2_01_FULL_39_63]OHA94934.1 MAG: hypothetical protein A3B88_00970 [Candidatus Zambryskibacteria bacterium RIFCSPHIGHO2_02_FULL_39_19]OHA99114.1 MAG: hypothetical protein A3F20_02920 [Candidatus Zambryskibacteria bacterium RIFCSPHIGHO2_12_FULL_39_21]OHB01876.1 MAG: hypothetical protein A3A96_00350 [Candidat